MHHLRHARPIRIALLKNGLAQGQPQLRQFNGAAQVVGDTGVVSIYDWRWHHQGSEKQWTLRQSVLDDRARSKRGTLIARGAHVFVGQDRVRKTAR